MVICSRVEVEVEVCLGRFTLDLMSQRAIQSPVDVSLKKSGVANSLCFHGEVDIPVKAIQMVKKTPQLLWTNEVGDVS